MKKVKKKKKNTIEKQRTSSFLICEVTVERHSRHMITVIKSKKFVHVKQLISRGIWHEFT